MLLSLYLSMMSLLWPTVGSDDSDDFDSDESKVEEEVRIIQKPIVCLAQWRKISIIQGKRIPMTMQLLSVDGKIPCAL